jgi:branched-chain amino acid transport system substrate-binding protein
MTRIRSFSLVLVLIAMLAGPVRSAEPVQVNVILPLSGSGALLGGGARSGLQVLEKRVNATGGIGGRPLQFVIADDQSNPQVAVQLANGLIAKNVPVILGSSLVALCGAIVPLLKNGPVLYCFSPGIHPQAGSYAFTAGIASGDLMAAQIHYLHERNIKRLAWIGTTDASGQDGEAGLDAAAALPANAGMTVIDREHFTIGDLGVDAQMARIKAANPDAIVSWASGTPMGTVMHGISESGLDKVPLLISAANLGYTALKQYAPTLPVSSYTAASAIFSADSVTDGAVKRALLDMNAAFSSAGMRADFLSSIPWDPGLMVVSALRKFGPDATAEQIRGYIAGLKGFVGINGRYDFAKVPQRGLSAENAYVVRWDGPGDRFVPVSRGGGVPVR